MEEMAPREDWERMVALYSSDHEKSWLSRLAPPRRMEVSYRLWTIKEAYLKAIGRGLSVSPAEIEVSLEGEDSYRFHKLNDESELDRNWRIIGFTPAPNFLASLVVDDGPTEIRYFHWEPSRLLKSNRP